MARRRHIGGNWFRTTDAITGVTTTNWGNVLILIVSILVLGLVAGVITWAVISNKPQSNQNQQTGGGAVGPPISTIPGRITIAEVAQAPSAGQAIIYFSQAEASGTTCQTCTATFDVNMTYVGGNPTQPPGFKTVTAPSTSGTVTFEYGASTGGFSPLTPGGNNTVPPSQVQLSITARSTNPQTGKSGPQTTFTKTIPYV